MKAQNAKAVLLLATNSSSLKEALRLLGVDAPEKM